jgi:hypothetical protein
VRFLLKFVPGQVTTCGKGNISGLFSAGGQYEPLRENKYHESLCGFHRPSRGHQYSTFRILWPFPSASFPFQRPLIVIICDIIEIAPQVKVSFLGGHSIGHSKQKHILLCVLFRTILEIELLHCTVLQFLIRKGYYALFLIPYLLFK